MVAADNPCVASTAQKQASAARRAKNRDRGEARPYPRVRARPIHEGQRYKITRRCHERRMFLTPGHDTAEFVNFIGYCLARAANMYGIQVHACVMMSNHHHSDVTDLQGKLPAFTQHLHSMIARGLNAQRNRTGSFWAGGKPCATKRPAQDETFQDLVYSLTNPVEAGLVKWSHQWPGFTTRGWRFGETRTFRRPTWFFDEDGDTPEEVSLTLVRPAIYLELDDDAFYDKLEQEVRRRELEHQAQFRRESRRIMGARKVRNQRWNHSPKSFEERFKVAPKVASSCKWMRLAQLQRDREWEREYAAARELLRAGLPSVFPAGTYWMRLFAGVDVAERGPP